MIMPADQLLVAADWSGTTPAQLLEAHLGRARNTARAYQGDVMSFAEFLQKRSGVGAVRALVELPRGAARRTLDNYVGWLRERYSLNTARRRLGCIRGLLRLAHEYGVIPWAVLAMPLPAPEPIRDTSGPNRREMEAMLGRCQERHDAKGARDGAMVRLMGVCGYRCNEVLGLDLKHLHLDSREIDILGKGNWGTGRRRGPVDVRTANAVGKWLEHRRLDDGPVFTTLARGRPQSLDRLSYCGMYEAICDLGRRVGIRHCHPHALRHTAATEFLRLTNGNVAWAMALTRHSDPKTVMIYNDQRLRRAREAMEIVAEGTPIYRYEPDDRDNS